MKRILLGSVALSITSLSFAMQPQLHEPSKRTPEYVKQALKAFDPVVSSKFSGISFDPEIMLKFAKEQSPPGTLLEPFQKTRESVEAALKALEIPIESVKIYGFYDGASRTGWANSDDRIISINENADVMEELFTEWICFHEAAHIKDESSRKIKTHPKFATGLLTSTCLGTYLFLNKTKFMAGINSRMKTFAHSVYGLLLAGSSYIFHDRIALPWAKEQLEIRADKIAIEGLLKMNNHNPIIYYLFNCLVLAEANGNKKTNVHPAPLHEYENTKKVLENNGYEVKNYCPQDAPDDLIVEIIKDNKHASLKVANFYSKV